VSKFPVRLQFLFEELGAEAVRKLEVVNMPLIVINDCFGNDLYKEGREKWSKI